MSNQYALTERKRSRLTSHFFIIQFLMLLIATSSASAQTIPCTPSNEPGTYATVSENPAGETIVRNKAGEDGISSVSDGTTAALATNRGTIVTCGNVHPYADDQGMPQFRYSIGVHALVTSGDQSATAINEAGALVESRGIGIDGVFVLIESGSSTGTGINNGTIVRRIARPDPATAAALVNTGLGGAVTGTGDLNLTNGMDGVIEGPFRLGMAGTVNSGAVTLVNAGRISIEPGLVSTVGMYASTAGELMRVINEGIIEVNQQNPDVRAGRAFGIVLASSLQHSGKSEVINRGRIMTRGFRATGISVNSDHAGSSDNPNTLRAVNDEGGTITVNGAMGRGITVVKDVGREDYNFGLLDVENYGDIIVTGDFLPTGGCYGPSGILAIHSVSSSDSALQQCTIAPEDTHHTGDVKVINTGTIRSVGHGVAGIIAANLGNGRTIVEMTDGTIVAGSRNPATNFGFGIMATVQTDHAERETDPDPSDDIDLEITVSGPSTTVTAYGEGADNPDTPWDDSRGIGIIGMVNGEITFVSQDPDLTGHMEIEISDGATITAERAVLLVGAKAYVRVFESTIIGDIEYDHHDLNDTLSLRGGFISGDIDFSGGDDMFKVENRGYIAGSVQFGEGNDTLILDVNGRGAQATSINGTISGLEMLTKKGYGQARIGNSMLAGGTLSIEDGELIVAGHLNLGDTGTVTVQTGSRLTFEVGNISSDSTSYGRITANSVVFQSGANKEVYIQLAPRPADESAVQAQLREGIDLLSGGTRFQTAGADGMSNAGTVVVRTTNGSVVGSSDDGGVSRTTADVGTGTEISRQPTAVSTPSASSDSGALYAGAALALLWWLARDDAETELVDYETSTQNMSNTSSFAQNQEPGIEFWAKTASNSINGLTPVQGISAGMDANFTSKGQLGISVEPLAAGFMKSEPLSLNRESSYTGNRYQIQVRWHSGAFFTSGSLSYGNYDASAQFRNPATEDGLLGGNFQMLHRHLQLTAGSRLSFGNELIFVPSLSVYQGSMKQSSYHAENSVLRAEVPGYSQQYQGWKLGFQVKSSNWRRDADGLNWYHSAGFSTQSFRSSGVSSLTLQQFDRTGALGFSTKLPVRGLPSTVHSFNAGIAVANSRNLQTKLNYVGLMTNGEFHHGAVIQTHYRF